MILIIYMQQTIATNTLSRVNISNDSKGDIMSYGIYYPYTKEYCQLDNYYKVEGLKEYAEAAEQARPKDSPRIDCKTVIILM